MTWDDGHFSKGQYEEVALSSSSDGGATWSTPVQVSSPQGRAAFTPSVAISSAGTVGITYYRLRETASGSTTLPADYWFRASTDGGATFGQELHVVGPFDVHTAPLAGARFLGDYQSLQAVGASFQPFFVMTNSGNTANRTDVVTTTITP